MTLVLLAPTPLGFHLFVRWPKDRIRRSDTLVDLPELGDLLRPLGEPLLVAVLGTRFAPAVMDQVGEYADVLAIPGRWLRTIPKSDVRRRAEVAARIATAHHHDPLQHYLSRSSDPHLHMPF